MKPFQLKPAKRHISSSQTTMKREVENTQKLPTQTQSKQKHSIMLRYVDVNGENGKVRKYFSKKKNETRVE